MRAGLGALAEAHQLHRIAPQELFHRHLELIAQLDPRLFSGELTAHQARVLRYQRLLSECGVPNPDGEAATALYRAAYKQAWQPLEGAVELLSRLRQQGLRLAILTNYVREVQLEKLAHCGLSSLIDAVLCIEDIPAAKPDPRAFQLGCERLEICPAEAVMVGDHWLNDVQGARAAGLGAIWLNRHGQGTPDQQIPMVSHLAEVEAVLSGWRRRSIDDAVSS